MSEPTLDVLTIGNALVDVLSHEQDAIIDRLDLIKGTMAMVDGARSDAVYAALGPGIEVSGGSAANTATGIASFGGSAGFVGRIGKDQFGQVFAHDLATIGVTFDPDGSSTSGPTGKCLVIVTPDAQRTMCTSLGVAGDLAPEHIPSDVVASARVTYLEGFLWDQPTAKEAFRTAARGAHDAGRQVALSLSDPFCVDRHRGDFLELIEGQIDVLFANEDEICSLYEVDDFDAALQRVRHHCSIAALTRSERGAVIVAGDEVHVVDAHPVDTVIDTTGAGDQYAAGFLHALTAGRDLAACGRRGALAASEVIGHLGARPEVSLADLAVAHGA
ncbi:MAG TPA: adenosine kinase [Acidimicrobiia bacterium]|nr:adenosine kinase [Acidimicrobiia bacterium]